jgi:hypothetical protein
MPRRPMTIAQRERRLPAVVFVCRAFRRRRYDAARYFASTFFRPVFAVRNAAAIPPSSGAGLPHARLSSRRHFDAMRRRCPARAVAPSASRSLARQ